MVAEIALQSRTEQRGVAPSRDGRAFCVVRIVLGLLLATAAGLKLYGLNMTALPRVGWFATPQVQVAAAEWELVLGLWLLSGAAQQLAWFAAVTTFSAFATVSAYLGWIGVVSCGCFGTVRISPWTAFAVDVVAVIGLCLFRPSRSPQPIGTQFGLARLADPAATIPLSAAAILVAMTGIGSWVFGSPAAALAHLRGDLVLAEPASILVHEPKAVAEVVREIALTNLTDQPIRILGGNTPCEFRLEESMPFTLAPGEQKLVHLRIRSYCGAWDLDEQLRLFVHGDDRPIVVSVVGRLVGPCPESTPAKASEH